MIWDFLFYTHKFTYITTKYSDLTSLNTFRKREFTIILFDHVNKKPVIMKIIDGPGLWNRKMPFGTHEILKTSNIVAAAFELSGQIVDFLKS